VRSGAQTSGDTNFRPVRDSDTSLRFHPKGKGKPRRVPYPWEEIGISKEEFWKRDEELFG